MVTELPVHIEFSLPDGWQAASPDEVGAPEMAFVAVRSGEDGFTTNLTVAGEIRDPAMPISAIADDSVHRIGEVAGSVRVRDRVALGPDGSPGMTQVLDIEMEQGEQLVQCQVYLSLDDIHDPQKHAVLELALTCTRERLDDVLPDFQRFVGTIRPRT
jgi:hypothetical protein